MKRTLIALLAAGFALAAGSSFAQAPAEPTPAPAAKTKAKPAKPAKHSKTSHKSSHKVASKKSKAHAA